MVVLKDTTAEAIVDFSHAGNDQNNTIIITPDVVHVANELNISIQGGAVSNALLKEEGVGFDGDLNNLQSKDAQDDDSTLTYSTTYLGDYDVNGAVNMDDLIDLSGYWRDDNTGPCRG